MKIILGKKTTPHDVRDAIDASVVDYMRTKRGLDERAMRDLLDSDPEVWASYMRKVGRAIATFIRDGVPAAFFAK